MKKIETAKHKNIIVLGIDPMSTNLGCAALAYSFFCILDTIGKRNNYFFDVLSLNNHYDSLHSEYYEMKSLRIKYKTPSFYKKYMKALKQCDFVIDFTEGDSFSDIYGYKRFFYPSLLKRLAIFSHKKLIMGPQTIGPFKSKVLKRWAANILNNCEKVFSRDNLSYDYCKTELNNYSFLTTDIAFLLPVGDSNGSFDCNKFKLGLNISGLLWNNGYTGKNEFGIQFDYHALCETIIQYCLKKDMEVHLIAHVFHDNPESPDNDYPVLVKLHEKYPQTILPVKFSNPMEAKAYISKMDAFIGARMHATIAAFSTGVPTLPIAYSRKFQGLYNSIDYMHVLDAKKENDASAFAQFERFIDNLDQIKVDNEKALNIAQIRNKDFIEQLEEIILE